MIKDFTYSKSQNCKWLVEGNILFILDGGTMAQRSKQTSTVGKELTGSRCDMIENNFLKFISENP